MLLCSRQFCLTGSGNMDEKRFHKFCFNRLKDLDEKVNITTEWNQFSQLRFWLNAKLNKWEAQGLDENEMRIQLKELYTKLHDVSSTGSDAADRLNSIEQEFRYKCPDFFDSVKEKFGNVREKMDSLNQQINREILNVEDGLEDLRNNDKLKEMMRDFPEYKKKMKKLFADSDEAFYEIDELNKMLKTCSASRPADETVLPTGGTTNIPLAPVSLTTAAAFIATKLAFH